MAYKEIGSYDIVQMVKTAQEDKPTSPITILGWAAFCVFGWAMVGIAVMCF